MGSSRNENRGVDTKYKCNQAMPLYISCDRPLICANDDDYLLTGQFSLRLLIKLCAPTPIVMISIHCQSVHVLYDFTEFYSVALRSKYFFNKNTTCAFFKVGRL
jgi:hypothetical protein